MKKSTIISIAAMAVGSSMALADFNAIYRSVDSGGSVTVDGTSFSAGHMNFDYDNSGGAERGIGQFAGGSFTTFCIELQGVRTDQSRTFRTDFIHNAPDPDSVREYDMQDEIEVHSVLLAAIDLGWINADLSLDGASNTQLSAIQGWIWKVVLDDVVVSGNGSVAGEMTTLANRIASLGGFNQSGRVAGLRAMIDNGSQDQLFIVPLPTAAFAGLLMLGGIGGFSRIRRR